MERTNYVYGQLINCITGKYYVEPFLKLLFKLAILDLGLVSHVDFLVHVFIIKIKEYLVDIPVFLLVNNE